MSRRGKKKRPKVLNKEKKIGCADKEKRETIKDCFTKPFHKENLEQQKAVEEVEMESPFTAE